MFYLRLLTLMRIIRLTLTTNILTCGKSIDIDLRNHKAYMSYAWTGRTINHTVENAFDRNSATFIVTYFSDVMDPIPAQYLDNGYNWVMVELSKEKFQMVDSVTLVMRTDIFIAKRIQDIEVLISNKIDYTPTMHTAQVAGKISWNNFVSCGTTGSASGDVTVDCSQNIVSSNYVAVRRNKESGSMDGYCCFTFSEFKVNLAAQLDEPKVLNVPWIRNHIAQISSKLSINCVLPSFLNFKWRKNESNLVELGHSTTLTISGATEEHVGTYYYEVFNARNMNLIFRSVSTEVVFIQNPILICNTACFALLSSAVVVLVITIISGAIWMNKYIRRIKTNSDAQEGWTENTPMENINCRNLIDTSNNAVVVVECENVNEPIGVGTRKMINENIGIMEDLYEIPNDVVNSTDLCTNDGYLKIINVDALEMMGNIRMNNEITEELYEVPNDVVNSTDVCTNDGYLKIINVDAPEMMGNIRMNNEITEELYEVPNDVVNSTHLYTNVRCLETIHNK